MNPSSLNLRIAILIFSSLVAAGCAGDKAVKPGTLRGADWVASLIQHAENDKDRDCVRGALQMSFALLAFKEGKFDDARVKSMLLDKLPDEQLRAIRTADYAKWSRTHKAAPVAEQHLSLCLADNGNRLAHSKLWLQCFSLLEPVAALSIYRQMGRSLQQATDTAMLQYAKSMDTSGFPDLGKQVYQLSTNADDLKFREQLFTQCLGGTE